MLIELHVRFLCKRYCCFQGIQLPSGRNCIQLLPWQVRRDNFFSFENKNRQGADVNVGCGRYHEGRRRLILYLHRLEYEYYLLRDR